MSGRVCLGGFGGYSREEGTVFSCIFSGGAGWVVRDIVNGTDGVQRDSGCEVEEIEVGDYIDLHAKLDDDH